MQNKNLVIAGAFMLLFAVVAVMALLPQAEQIVPHVYFHAFIIVVALLFVHMESKDILIIIMLGSAAVWALAFMGMVFNSEALVVETVIIMIATIGLGWYGGEFRTEKVKNTHILNYKKQQVEADRKKTAQLNAENARLLDEIKNLRRELQD